MSGLLLAKDSLVDSLSAHIAASLQVDPSDQDEMDGVERISSIVLDYFKSSCKGAPTGGAQVLQWVIMSAIWEGHIPQSEIDEFFQRVNVDLGKLISSWKKFSEEERKSVMSLVLIPGKLNEATIADVTAALYHNMQK